MFLYFQYMCAPVRVELHLVGPLSAFYQQGGLCLLGDPYPAFPQLRGAYPLQGVEGDVVPTDVDGLHLQVFGETAYAYDDEVPPRGRPRRASTWRRAETTPGGQGVIASSRTLEDMGSFTYLLLREGCEAELFV